MEGAVFEIKEAKIVSPGTEIGDLLGKFGAALAAAKNKTLEDRIKQLEEKLDRLTSEVEGLRRQRWRSDDSRFESGLGRHAKLPLHIWKKETNATCICV